MIKSAKTYEDGSEHVIMTYPEFGDRIEVHIFSKDEKIEQILLKDTERNKSINLMSDVLKRFLGQINIKKRGKKYECRSLCKSS